jgi:vanillate O-demethylase monooxygenase subunit
MRALDHWHPVALSDELQSQPRTVTLCGEGIVLFRGAGGRVGALVDRCPHRGLPLSRGRVDNDRLVCAYHGWSWGRDGEGTSPGNAKVGGCARHFDTVERHGAVWLRNPASGTTFPHLDVSGYHLLCRLRHRVAAPLGVVLDNFIEVEHTGNVHLFFGYPTERMAEVVSEVTLTDDSVRVFNRGPQRPMPNAVRRAFRIGPDDEFVDDWTTRFSPIYTVYDHYWVDPATETRRPDALRIAIFFNPVDATSTELFTFAYSAQPPWGRAGLNRLLQPITALLVDLEIKRDLRLLPMVDPAAYELKGRALGRFDKALVACRKRIDRVYHGNRAGLATLEA